MNKEKPLSETTLKDKRFWLEISQKKHGRYKKSTGAISQPRYYEKDIIKAVKKLKEEFEQIDIIDSCITDRIIDKIMGSFDKEKKGCGKEVWIKGNRDGEPIRSAGQITDYDIKFKCGVNGVLCPKCEETGDGYMEHGIEPQEPDLNEEVE